MILHELQPARAKVEFECREWLRGEFGKDDADTLATWFWDNHRKMGAPYIEALQLTVQQTIEGGRDFGHKLLDVAKKPRHVREAEVEIVAFITPLLKQLHARILGERGNPQTVLECRDEYLHRFEEKLKNMFPDTHHSMMKGAILAALDQPDPGAVAAAVVKQLNLPDPVQAARNAARA